VAVYRRAAAAELPALATFCGQAYGTDPAYFRRRWTNDPVSDSFNAVLEAAGQVVAHLRVFSRPIFVDRQAPPQRCAGVGNVAVASTQRGRGWSTALLRETLADCALSGFDLSLLHTHLPGVYTAAGYSLVPVAESAVSGTQNAPWRDVVIDTRLRELYEREHGGRPGTVARDDEWWRARQRWLAAEGWHTIGLNRVDGYCCVRQTVWGGEIDEAVGECASVVRVAPPSRGRWRTRDVLGTAKSGVGRRDSLRMGFAISAATDLASLAGAGAVSWRTDEF
jgi:GNAT superfamily N-acetyltransferase